MEPGQSSGTKDDDQPWAKLVPLDPRYREIEIKASDTIICSKIADSSSEKQQWCRITRGSDSHSATIRSVSSLAIVVNGATVGEEVVDIASGSEIISGPDREGYLGYTFELVPIQEQDQTNVKISFNVEHAKCGICLNVWHDVVTVAPCLHNFCNGCFSEWLRRSSSQSRNKDHSVNCPQCRAILHSAGRNHFLHNIEEAILQAFSSLKRSEEEIAQLDTNASVKPIIVLGMLKSKSRKRPLSLSSDESSGTELPCPQCGTELGGFRCSRTTAHIQCHDCRGMMPSRPNIAVPQQYNLQPMDEVELQEINEEGYTSNDSDGSDNDRGNEDVGEKGLNLDDSEENFSCGEDLDFSHEEFEDSVAEEDESEVDFDEDKPSWMY